MVVSKASRYGFQKTSLDVLFLNGSLQILDFSEIFYSEMPMLKVNILMIEINIRLSL